MRYRSIRAEYIAADESSVLADGERIGISVWRAKDGDAFFARDRIYMPDPDGKGERPFVFENFAEAAKDGMSREKVADAAISLLGFSLNFMDEEKFFSLSPKQMAEIYDLAQEAGIGDNMENQASYAVPDDLEAAVERIASPKRKPGPRA